MTDRTMHLRLLVIVLIVEVGCWGSAVSQDYGMAAVENTISEQHLGEFHITRLSECRSPDGLHLAYVIAPSGKGYSVVVDGKIGPEYDGIAKGTPIFSPDSNHVAYPAAKEGSMLVVVNGKEGLPYDGIAAGYPVFSPDSMHIAYVAKQDTKWQVVVDNRAGPQFDVCGQVTFSPNSDRIAYLAWKGGRAVVVVDGHISPEYDGIVKGTPVFSRDSKHIAYIAGESGKDHVVVNGNAYPEYSGIQGLWFSPDSSRLAYTVKKGIAWQVIVDNQAGPEYDGVGGLAFSPDSKRVAYDAWRGDDWQVIVDGQAGLQYDGIAGGRPVFSPDSQRLAYVAGRRGKMLAVLDGQEGPEYDGIGGLVFSPDSKRVAYVALRAGKMLAVVDGQAAPECDGIGGILFSPDSRHVAVTIVENATWQLVLDGEAGPQYGGIVSGTPIFSLDSQRLAYVAIKEGKKLVVLDGHAGREYEGITGLAFSSDGKHSAYVAWEGGKWNVTIDGQTGPQYYGIVTQGPILRSDQVLEYLAHRNGSLFRVSHTPQQTATQRPQLAERRQIVDNVTQAPGIQDTMPTSDANSESDAVPPTRIENALVSLGYLNGDGASEKESALRTAINEFTSRHFDFPMDEVSGEVLAKHLEVASVPGLIDTDTKERIPVLARYRIGTSEYGKLRYAIGGCHATVTSDQVDVIGDTILREARNIPVGKEIILTVAKDLRGFKTPFVESNSDNLDITAYFSDRLNRPETDGRILHGGGDLIRVFDDIEGVLVGINIKESCVEVASREFDDLYRSKWYVRYFYFGPETQFSETIMDAARREAEDAMLETLDAHKAEGEARTLIMREMMRAYEKGHLISKQQFVSSFAEYERIVLSARGDKCISVRRYRLERTRD